MSSNGRDLEKNDIDNIQEDDSSPFLTYESDSAKGMLTMLQTAKFDFKAVSQWIKEKKARDALLKNRIKNVRDSLFKSNFKRGSHTYQTKLKGSFQMLDLEFCKVLASKDKKLKKDSEVLIETIELQWQPYLTPNMTAVTTILVCDNRSKQYENIVKGGSHFATSTRPKKIEMIIPLYSLISLEDVNKSEAFRFVVVTQGLDYQRTSFYGRLTISIDYIVGQNLKGGSDEDRKVRLISPESSTARTILNTEQGPINPLTKSIDLQAIVLGYRRYRLKNQIEESKERFKRETFMSMKELKEDQQNPFKDLLIPGSSSKLKKLNNRCSTSSNNSASTSSSGFNATATSLSRSRFSLDIRSLGDVTEDMIDLAEDDQAEIESIEKFNKMFEAEAMAKAANEC